MDRSMREPLSAIPADRVAGVCGGGGIAQHLACKHDLFGKREMCVCLTRPCMSYVCDCLYAHAHRPSTSCPGALVRCVKAGKCGWYAYALGMWCGTSLRAISTISSINKISEII
eukprot:scaffold205971_cov35-Tisochrysis_lutea.AAC.1